jgi:hypothetical protein
VGLVVSVAMARTPTRPDDQGTETFNPLLEQLLDRHHAEAMSRAESHHRTQMAAIKRMESAMVQRHEAVEAKLDSLIAAVNTFRADVEAAKAAAAAEDDAAENPSLQRMTEKIDAALASFATAAPATEPPVT